MMAFRCGTYDSPTTTGQHDAPLGCPEIPTALVLCSSGVVTIATVEQHAWASFGATDGTTQWTDTIASIYDNSGTVTDATVTARSQHSDTSVLRVIDDSGVVVAEAEFVSFNADGTATLDWTTAPATAIQVAFMAWTEVTALAGITLVSSGSNTYTVDVSSVTSDLKFVIGANQWQFADALISFGWGDATSTVGKSWTCRAKAAGVGPTDDFVVLSNPSQNAYLWSVASSTSTGGASIENLTDDSFDIVSSTTNLTFTDNPVGWLAIGDGGEWSTKIDVGSWIPSYNVALGAITLGRDVLGSDPHQHFTIGWGAWDETDSQFVMMNYLEEDAGAPAPNAITSRALYDDRTHIQMSGESTVDGYTDITSLGAGIPGRPTLTIHGTTPQQNVILWFVYPAGDYVQSWLV